MSSEFEAQAPKAYVRLCETLSAQGDGPAVTVEVGEVIRVLSASRPGGVFLCVGDGAGESGTWVLDGMDLSSRLVVVVEDAHAADTLRAVFGDDLRITVHVQEAVAFLGDVRDHRFDLITDLSREQSPRLTELELGRLGVGAFFMTRHSCAALAEMLSDRNAQDGTRAALDLGAFTLARLPGELGVTLLAHRSPRPEAKRRGGRRSRAGVTPLFSSRPRTAGDRGGSGA